MAPSPRPASRFEWIFGVVAPALILGPFMAFGLLGAGITFLTRRATLEPASREIMGILVLLAIAGGMGLVGLATVLRSGPEAIRARLAMRVACGIAIGTLVAAGLFALRMQVPSVAWSLGDPKNWFGLLFQVPALVLLAGPVLVGSKYLYLLVRRSERLARR